jgi:hypothetical protein
LTATDELIAAIRDGLAAAADPKRAPGMQAYMKSAMPLAHFAARCVQLVPLAPISRPDAYKWYHTYLSAG